MNTEINPVKFFKVVAAILALCLVAGLLIVGIPAGQRKRAEIKALQYVKAHSTTSAATPDEAAEKLLRMSIKDNGARTWGRPVTLTGVKATSRVYGDQATPVEHIAHVLPSRRELPVWKVSGVATVEAISGTGVTQRPKYLPIVWSVRMTWDAKEKRWHSRGTSFTWQPQK